MSRPGVVLETARLYLRRLTPADAPLLHALDSDPEVMRYISKGRPTPLHVIAEQKLPRWLRYYDEAPWRGFWAAHERATDAFVGWFHLRPDGYEPGATELGYRLARRVWGRGYATEGGRAFIEQAFGQTKCDHVTARTLAGNTASQRVMAKCGLRFEEPFVYPQTLLRNWTKEERRAVKFGLWRRDFEAAAERNNRRAASS